MQCTYPPLPHKGDFQNTAFFSGVPKSLQLVTHAEREKGFRHYQWNCYTCYHHFSIFSVLSRHTSTPPMGRTACTEPQCLYRGALYLYLLYITRINVLLKGQSRFLPYTGLFVSPSWISELDCATTKTDTAESSISIGRESLQVFFLY